MRIVVFVHKNSGEAGRNLMDYVSACQLPRPLVRVQTIGELRTHLMVLGENREKEILLLLAESSDRLEALAGMGSLLEDSRLILVVPDEAPATLSQAHQLFPRFLTPVADRYGELCAVIDRMMANHGSRKSGPGPAWFQPACRGLCEDS